MGVQRIQRKLIPGIAGIALAATGLTLSASAAGAAGAGATPVEANMSTQVLACANQDLAGGIATFVAVGLVGTVNLGIPALIEPASSSHGNGA